MESVINFENMFSFPAENVLEFLQRTMDEEIQKGKKAMDIALIEECVLIIKQLYGEERYCPTKAQIDEKYNELEEKLEKVREDKEFWEALYKDNDSLSSIINNEASHPRTKRFGIKKLFIIAAAVMLLATVSVSTVVADTPFHFVNMLLLDTHIDDISEGETISKGNITVTKGEHVKSYNTFEELLEEKNLHGIYFSDTLEIKSILFDDYKKTIELNITPTERDVFFAINITQKDEYGLQYDVPAYTKTTTENGIDVWKYDKGEKMAQYGRYQLMFKIKDWYYCVDTSYPEKGYELINDFTEITP